MLNFPGYLQQKAKILHFGGGFGGNRTENSEKLARKINTKNNTKRVFCTNKYGTFRVITNKFNTRRGTIVNSIKRRGVLETLKLGYEKIREY